MYDFTFSVQAFEIEPCLITIHTKLTWLVLSSYITEQNTNRTRNAVQSVQINKTQLVIQFTEASMLLLLMLNLVLFAFAYILV